MNLQRTLAVSSATLAAVLLFAAPRVARPQQTQGPIAPKPDKPVQQPPEGTIRVRVALVSAPVVVVDAKGEPVLDLQQKDFHILDDGIDQTIEAFELGGEQVSTVLVFETSSRIAPLLPTVQKSAIVFTQTVVGPSGQAAVISYDDAVNTVLPFSTDNDKIEKTIANLKPGNSGARLYDAPPLPSACCAAARTGNAARLSSWAKRVTAGARKNSAGCCATLSLRTS